jgi:hypothetical protein
LSATETAARFSYSLNLTPVSGGYRLAPRSNQHQHGLLAARCACSIGDFGDLVGLTPGAFVKRATMSL